MSAADTIPAVRAVLLADGDITTLVIDRVYDGEIPEPPTDMPQAAIVLNAAGGNAYPGGGFQPYGVSRIDVWCYGETLKQSRQLYLAVYSALKNMRTRTAAGVQLKSVVVETKGATGRDPERQWPLTLSSWRVLHSETS